jgi:tripeptide aminopeptidase
MQLMPIRGKSGEEQDVADFIVKQLIAAGAKITAVRFDNAHKKTPIDGQVGNLIFKIPGTKSGPRRLLMAHMDTVPICVGCQPVRKGKLVRSADPATALGADDRAGCAVVLNAALRILRQQPDHPPLTFLWTIQEEIGLHGARNLRVGMLGKPALAFNWDGGNPAKLTIGATGGYRMQIDVDGIASHAGNAPEHGVSAIAIASVAIASLQADGWHGLVTKHGRRGSSNVGVVRGGDATNVVTDHVTLRVEARSHDPKFRRQIVQQVKKAFRTAARQVRSASGKTGKVSFQGQLDYESFQLDQDEPNVIAAKTAVKAAGEKPITSVTNGGVDANWMALHGVPTVTLGCGQMHPHTVKEALNVAEFESACEIAWRLATATE